MSLHKLSLTDAASIEAYTIVLQNDGIKQPDAMSLSELCTIREELKTRNEDDVEMLDLIWLQNRIDQLRAAGQFPKSH